MDEAAFWELIAAANCEDGEFEVRVDALEDRLVDLPPEEVEEFYLRYDERVTAAWQPELVRVAFLANRHLACGGDGRCDADDFFAFVCWLVDQGREVYTAALLDPDSLATHPEDPLWESDGLWVAAAFAWEIQRGGGSFYDALRDRAAGFRDLPEDRVGVEDADFRRHLPRLSRRLLGAAG
jgi:hypothetical protein